MHSGQPKPYVRCKRKVLSGLEGLLEIVGFNVMAEVSGPVHIRREGVPDCSSCDAETVLCSAVPFKMLIWVTLIH